jgi:energy-coupling factor transport system permease protein
VLASVATIAALALGGYLAPAVVFATLVTPGAIAAGVARRVVTGAATLALPLGIAVALVSVFTQPGSTVLFELGPFEATLEGVDFAAKVIVRLFVMAAALVLFGQTTTTRALVVDLERRGVSPRLAFALGAVAAAVPALLERAREVRDAQRARALDTEGSLRRRVAGVVPLVGPVVIGALHQVEQRSLALEARAFGRPGTRHLLWAPADRANERATRWLLLAALVAVLAGTFAGVIPKLP